MPAESKQAPTAEELKEMVRRYADAHAPGWSTAGIMVRLGTGQQMAVEELLVLPSPRLTPQPSA